MQYEDPRRLLIGIDPGITGGIALLDLATLDLLDGFAVPSANSKVLMPDLLDRLESGMETAEVGWTSVGQVVIENVNSYGQGRTSAFTFGRAVGNLEALAGVLRWPLDYITPSQWKRRVLGVITDKDSARQWCRRRWPTSELFNKIGEGQAIGDAAAMAVAWWELHR